MNVDKERTSDLLSVASPAPGWYRDAVRECSQRNKRAGASFVRCVEAIERTSCYGLAPGDCDAVPESLPAPGPSSTIPRASVGGIGVAIIIIIGAACIALLVGQITAPLPLPQEPYDCGAVSAELAQAWRHVGRVTALHESTLAALAGSADVPSPRLASPSDFDYVGPR